MSGCVENRTHICHSLSETASLRPLSVACDAHAAGRRQNCGVHCHQSDWKANPLHRRRMLSESGVWRFTSKHTHAAIAPRRLHHNTPDPDIAEVDLIRLRGGLPLLLPASGVPVASPGLELGPGMGSIASIRSLRAFTRSICIPPPDSEASPWRVTWNTSTRLVKVTRLQNTRSTAVKRFTYQAGGSIHFYAHQITANTCIETGLPMQHSRVAQQRGFESRAIHRALSRDL